jgi:endoglucanase
MLKKTVLFAFVFAFFCNAANFTSTHGKLSVNGGKILDKNNNEVVLRGMSLYWYNGPWNGGQPGNAFYTSSVVSDLANNWGASLVRAAIGDVNQNTSGAVTVAKNMMDWANNAGIYVIIDNHSHSAHNETQNVQSFFNQVSAYVKQKNYTHVIYEIYNEPLSTPWATIKSFAQNVITTIRNNDADGLIVVGTPSYSSAIGAARSDPLTGTYAKNVLYTLHFYAGESGHGNYRDALEGAYCANFPVFVTEWGTSPASGNGTISTSNSNTWISLLEAAKVSHANWSLSAAGESSAALNGGTDIKSNLKESGTYVKNLITKLNNGTSITGICTPNKPNECLTARTINCSSVVPTGPDGKIEFGYAGSMANFLSKNGADSVSLTSGWALGNTSANFTANYTLVGIPGPGLYLIRFQLASTAGGTVSWSGSGISSGDMQIPSTGSLTTLQYTEPKLISISASPEAPLNLSFQTSSAGSLRARYILVDKADSADSAKFNIAPIRNLKNSGKSWNYDAILRAFVFENNEGSLAIYNLRGERKALFAASGSVSLTELPTGSYLAVYKHSSQIESKIIHLK